jgi:Sulfotransferase domain
MSRRPGQGGPDCERRRELTLPDHAPIDPATELRAKLPNLLIVGVPKAGTTSLFRHLAQHPEICGSPIKELRYFEAVRYGEPIEPLDTYAAHFDHCSGQRFRLESTPGYFGGGPSVADAVSTMLDDPRVLVCLRDPVARCWSWYRFVRGRARIPKDMTFASYLDTCERLRAADLDGLRENQPYTGLRGGCYDECIDAWHRRFGSAFRVVFFDDLADDPKDTVIDILRWLDLDAEPAERFRFEVENRSVQYRSRRVLGVALTLNRRGEAFFERHPDLKRRLRSIYYAVNRDSAAEILTPAERERLTTFYAPHNARLAASLRAAGVDRLPDWLS